METKKQRLLILGAYGLVGSNLCKILERDFYDIELTKIKCNEGIAGLPTSYYDYVIFGAGYGQPQKFSQDKIGTIQLNTDSVMCCFNKIKTTGRFLFVSTSEVYSGAPSPHTEDMIGTTTPQHPRACYIEGKRCGEAICMAYKEQGYDVKIARLALAYGPGTKKGDTRVINQFIEQALTTGKIVMKDGGGAMRTYIYVEDAAKMILDVLFKGKDVVYNIGGESRIPIRNLAEWISTMTDSEIFYGENPLEGSPNDVWLNINKVMNEFPRELTTMREGLRRTIDYQKQLYGIN